MQARHRIPPRPLVATRTWPRATPLGFQLRPRALKRYGAEEGRVGTRRDGLRGAIRRLRDRIAAPPR